MKPFVTVNIDGPPTLHMQATVSDLLAAAESLKQYALATTVIPAKPQAPKESWDDKEDLITK